MTTEDMTERDALKSLRADLLLAAKTLTHEEARYLVDLYYQVQNFRLAAGNQRRAATKAVCHVCDREVTYRLRKRPKAEKVLVEHPAEAEAVPVEGEAPVEAEATDGVCDGSGAVVEKVVSEPSQLVTWTFGEFETIEKRIREAMDVYTDEHVMGRWAKSIVGVGPVISAGLLAHIDMDRTPGLSNLYSFAGLNPAAKWSRGEKRPWNARLKVLIWKVGDSFMKTRNRDGSNYGHFFERKWAREKQRNAAGELKDQAVKSLDEKRWKKGTEAYKAYSKGELPAQRILLRAERWAAKIFLSHWFTAAFFSKHGKLPRLPYALEFVPGPHEFYPVPNTELVPGLAEALVAWENLNR